MLNILWIALGGALGSVCRYTLGVLFPWDGSGFPMATFLANSLAALVLGVVAGLLISKFSNVEALKYFVVIGFCGGFSTFSSFAFELFKINQQGSPGMMAFYAIISIIVSVALIFLGYSLTSNLN